MKTKTAQDTAGYLGKLNDRPFFVPAMSKKSLRLMDEKTYMDQTQEKMERQKERANAFQSQQTIQNLKPGQKKLLGGKAVKNYMAFEDEVTEKELQDLTYEDDDGQQKAILQKQRMLEKELYYDLQDMRNIASGIGQVIDRQTGQIGAIAENVSDSGGCLDVFGSRLLTTFNRLIVRMTGPAEPTSSSMPCFARQISSWVRIWDGRATEGV